MAGSSVRGNAPCERQFLSPYREVAGVDDLGCDVHAVFELERNQVRLAVLDFIKSGFFPCAALDIGEGVVVVDGGNQKRLATRFPVKWVVELELRCVVGAEMVDLLGGLRLRRVELLRGVRAERF